MILVTGATGNAGGATARALVASRQPVRALIRDESRRPLLPPGVEEVVGDLNQASTLGPALEGVRAVFLLSGYDQLEDALTRMRDSGVERVVLLSSSAAPGGDMGNAIASYHIQSQQAVQESGLPWTFLQPNSFMSNTLQWLPQLQMGDVVRAPFGDVPVAMTDPDDLGAVAAEALASDAHEGRAYRLSGPTPLLPAERVETLAKVSGRPLRFEAMANDEARAELSAQMPAKYVDALFSFFVDGTVDESEVFPTVQHVTGRPPGSFEQWALRHVDELR